MFVVHYRRVGSPRAALVCALVWLGAAGNFLPRDFAGVAIHRQYNEAEFVEWIEIVMRAGGLFGHGQVFASWHGGCKKN